MCVVAPKLAAILAPKHFDCGSIGHLGYMYTAFGGRCISLGIPYVKAWVFLHTVGHKNGHPKQKQRTQRTH